MYKAIYEACAHAGETRKEAINHPAEPREKWRAEQPMNKRKDEQPTTGGIYLLTVEEEARFNELAKIIQEGLQIDFYSIKAPSIDVDDEKLLQLLPLIGETDTLLKTVDRWEQIRRKPFFMLMRAVTKYRIGEEVREGTEEWYYLRSDKTDKVIMGNPIMQTIPLILSPAPDTDPEAFLREGRINPIAALLEDNKDLVSARTRSAEQEALLAKVRDGIDLPEAFCYLSINTFTNANGIVVPVFKAIIDLLKNIKKYKTGKAEPDALDKDLLSSWERLLKEHPETFLELDISIFGGEYHTRALEDEGEQLSLDLLSQDLATSKGMHRRKEATSTLPAPMTAIEGFATIHQGVATNALTKARVLPGDYDKISHAATVKDGSFTLTISDYDTIKGLRPSVQQLFDALAIELTKTGAKSPTVTIPFSRYMEMRGLKDRKAARERAIEDLQTLRKIGIEWDEPRKKETRHYAFVNIADSGYIDRDIHFVFGSTFYGILKQYPIMRYPEQLLRIDTHKNPNSLYIGRKCAEHKNMNAGKPNEDIISVKTLLEVCKYIPSYETVMKENKNVSKRIIEPFERDLDALSDTFKWGYCHSHGSPLTDEEYAAFGYSLFITLNVKITWNNYPDQTARLERKAEAIEKAKKGKTSKKKKPDPA